ncbi:MAG: methionyl-tRNA formyltransferase [Patescibacteria group bacterium]|nr:methionyl-tRNA formyltransferase [Patescibacteria group bacterium]
MQKEQLKLVFMGTPEFSVKILEGILNDSYNIIGVITEPDKPVGRSQELVPTPVKKFALEKGLKVFQPEKKINVFEAVSELNPDLVVVAAYGKIITKETLEVPKYGCINFHGSLLPKLRGASPIQTAILEGAEKTGVTIMVMDENMDTGPILTTVEIPLDKKETTTTLRAKMLEYGLPLLLKTIPEYVDGELKPIVQNNDEVTYTKMIEKEDGRINFEKSAEEEERKLRAFNEWPGTFCFWDSKRIKFIEVDSSTNYESNTNIRIGEVFLDENKNLCVNFAKGFWIIEKLQIEGGKPMLAKDFLNGNKDFVDATLN